MELSRRLSRWSMAYFACAFANLLIATSLMAAGLTYPSKPIGSPLTLIGVHLVTIGWLSLLMLGALAQFVPVITTKPLPSQRAALGALFMMEIGLAGMIAGFLALNDTLPGPASVALSLGGILVVLGAVVAGINIAIPLLRSRPLPLPGRMIVAALVYFAITVLLGLCFAAGLSINAASTHFARLLTRGLPLHLMAGLGGWFLLTAIGVSYKLLPMFMLAPEERGVTGEWVFGLTAGGMAVAWLGGLSGLWYPGPAASWAQNGGLAAAALGIVIYLLDAARLYQARRRKVLELNSVAALGALIMLGFATGLGIIAAAAKPMYWTAAIFLLLIGYLSGLGLSQLYKIIPFLTWLERFGSRLGQGPVPRVQELVNETRAVPWFGLYFLAVGAIAAGTLTGTPLLTRLGSFLTVLAEIGVARELWRARHPGEVKPGGQSHFLAAITKEARNESK